MAARVRPRGAIIAHAIAWRSGSPVCRRWMISSGTPIRSRIASGRDYHLESAGPSMPSSNMPLSPEL
jgi:hypothetical protein